MSASAQTLATDASLNQAPSAGASFPRGGLPRQDREKFPENVGSSWDINQEFIHHEVSSSVLYIPTRKAKSSAGKISIIESEFEYSYNLKLFDQLPVTVSFDNEYINIDSTAALDLPSHLVGLSAGLETTLPVFIFEKTYVNIGINPSFYSDGWNAKSSAFRMPTDIFVIYNHNDRLTLIGGVAVCPDFKKAVLPVIGCIYKPNDTWAIEMTSDASRISYSVHKKVDIFLEMTTPVGSEFEVTRDQRQGVVLEYNEMLAGAGIKYTANKFVQASLAVGGAFNRYIKYRDEDGKLSIKNGLYTECRVDILI